MMDSISVSYSTPGWTCSFCGQYVQYGESHQCPRYAPYPQRTYPTYPEPTETSQLIAAINRLAAALDALAARLESQPAPVPDLEESK